MVSFTVPSKAILFGEHAVVFGEPAVAIALDLKMKLTLTPLEGESIVDGFKLDPKYHSYIWTAAQRLWKTSPELAEKGFEIKISSSIPTSSGLGSSAALTVSTVACMLKLRNMYSEENVAKNSFEVEYETQGRASPIDTSTVTHGSSILLNGNKSENFLWQIERNDKSWYVHHCDLPDLTFVVGFSGKKGKTGEQVAKVKRFVEHSGFAREIIREIGDVTREGVKALKSNNKEQIGKLMDKNHKLLAILGVNTPELERLVQAAKRTSYGAKITGAGGGGCMIALTDDPEATAKSILHAKGTPYIVHISHEGVKLSG